MRRFWFRSFAALACSWACGTATWAQAPAQATGAWPSKPIKWVIPYTPGGLTDSTTRMVIQKVQELTGWPIVLENKPGANSLLGSEFVARAQPDGYTFLTVIAAHAANATLYAGRMPYDPVKSFSPVSVVGITPLILTASNGFAAKDVKELISYAKANPDKVSYGSSGVGAAAHLTTEFLKLNTGTQMVHVPYKGGAPANQDLIGGQVDIFITVYGKSYQQLADSGKIKILAMLNNERLEGVKQYPAISESKQLKNFTHTIWTGFFVKKDTPEPIVQALHKAVTETLGDPAVRAGLDTNSQQVPRALSLQEASKAYAEGTAQFRAIAKSINLQPQ